MIALTTFDSLVRYMGSECDSSGNPVNVSNTFDAGAQATIQEMIESVSQTFEQYCARFFTQDTYTFSNKLAGQAFFIDAYPIVSVTSVSVSPCGRRAQLQPWSDYEIGPSSDCLIFFGLPENTLVEVVFVGGLSTDTDDVIANQPSLAGFCNLQVATLWRRHNTADRTGMSLGTGTTSWNKEYKLLDVVSDGLDAYYRSAHNFI